MRGSRGACATMVAERPTVVGRRQRAHAPTRQQQAPLRAALVGGHTRGEGVVIRRAQHGEHGRERGQLHVLLDEAPAHGQRQLPRRIAWAVVRQVLR